MKTYSSIPNGWQCLNCEHLYRHFVFPTLSQSISFINTLSSVFDKEDHHPDKILVTGNGIDFYLLTHSSNSITDKDICLAIQIEGIYRTYSHKINNKNNIFFYRIENLLSSDIEEAWKKTYSSSRKEMYKQFSLVFEKSNIAIPNFSASNLARKSPNPIHELIIRDIGVLFMKRLAKLGISYDFYFPGDFMKSIEVKSNGERARTFYMTLFCNYGQNKLCDISLKFKFIESINEFALPVFKVEECFEVSPELYINITHLQ
jgi:4a-hydroxytetrahydrobiopterin dehydratase